LVGSIVNPRPGRKGVSVNTCYECAKQIKGVHIRLGIDFPKAFHPACYAKAEKRTEAELQRYPA